METLEQIVSENMIALRKKRMWTQAELAEKLHYSDKSVSKWERGEALPDLKVLKAMADLYGVTVDYFLTENAFDEPERYISEKSRLGYQIWVIALAICLIFLTATVIFAYISINGHRTVWQVFVWAVPISLLAVTYFDRRWFHGRCTLITASAFCWTLATAIFLQWLPLNLWMLYIVCVPAQICLILLSLIRRAR